MTDSPSSIPNTPHTPGTPDISVGPTTGSCPSSRLVISVLGEKFIPNGHSISKTITGTFMERQDATGYTWKDVCQSTRDFYWHEFMKYYQWNATNDAIIKHTWKKVASSLYPKKMYNWRHEETRPLFIREDVWDSWNAHWSSDKWLDKSRVAAQNRASETGGPGTGPSKHTGGSRSSVEHTIKLSIDLGGAANSWDLFKKIHVQKDGTFVDAKSKRISDQMEVAMAAAAVISNPLDDTQDNIDPDYVIVNRLYLGIVGGEKKRRVYGLGSQGLTMYKDCNSTTLPNLHMADQAAEERIQLLEEEMLRMRENQERILQQRVEVEVHQCVEQEVVRLREQSDERFQSMEERMRQMMNKMASSSQLPGDPTHYNRDSPNAEVFSIVGV